MSNRGNAPKQLTWIICLILFVIALLNHFGIVKMGNGIGDWSWIVGYAVLLIAVQIRGL